MQTQNVESLNIQYLIIREGHLLGQPSGRASFRLYLLSVLALVLVV